MHWCTGYRGALELDVEFKALAFTVTTLFTTVILLFYGILFAEFGRAIDALIMFALVPLLILNVVICRRTQALVPALLRMVCVIYTVAAYLVILEAGHGPTSWWMIMPAYILVSSGLYRDGLIAFLLSIAFLGGVEIARMADWIRPVSLGTHPDLLVQLSRLGLFAAVLLALYIINRLRDAGFLKTLRLNEALTLANLKATAAVDAKSRFLATMSHEIRTPLHGMLSAAELLGKSTLDRDQARLVGILRQSGEHLGELVNAVLDFSKAESGKLELELRAFDVRDLVEDVADTHTMNAHAKGLVLSAWVAAEVPYTLIGDPARIRQILNNLLGNAIKFTTTGQVGLEAAMAEPGFVAFTVWDTGAGIPAAALARVFEPFTQADESITRLYGGSGLGLALCAELAQALGGQLAVDSTPNQGSRFTCLLPLARAAEEGVQVECDFDVMVLDPVPEAARALAATVGACGGTIVKKFPPAQVGRARVALLNSRVWNDVRALADLAELPADTLLILVTSMGRSVPTLLAGQHFSDIVREPVRRRSLQEVLRRLARAEERAEPIDEVPDRREILSRGVARRILLVEDNPVNQLLAQSMLERLGCAVDTADNGQRALEMWLNERYEVVLMDCQMPIMDGLAAARRMRELELVHARPRTRIVALTANAFAEDRESCVAAGMDEFLAKPFTYNQLAELIMRPPVASSRQVIR